MGAGLLAVKSGFILFIKSYQFSLQINTLERGRGEGNLSPRMFDDLCVFICNWIKKRRRPRANNVTLKL
jgi:hypothetical protein